MRFSVAGIGEAGQAGKTPRAVYLTENGPVMWGRTGENGAAVLYLDVSEWLSERPAAQVQAAFERADGLCYPVECRVADGFAAVTLGAAETECAGEARIEYRLMEEGVVQKSHAYRGWIEAALTGEDAEPENPGKAFVDRVFEQADSANAAAQRAEAAAERADAAEQRAEAAADRAEDVIGNIKSASADWNQNDPNGDGYILNRPMYAEGGFETNWDGKTMISDPVVVRESDNYATWLVKVSNKPWQESDFEWNTEESSSDIIESNTQIHLVVTDGTNENARDMPASLFTNGIIAADTIAISVKNAGSEFDGIVFNEPGVYFVAEIADGTPAMWIKSASAVSRNIVKMPEMFVPDAVWEGISSARTIATDTRTVANNAQTAANNAQTAANNAQTAANNAQNTANSAKTTAENAQEKMSFANSSKYEEVTIELGALSSKSDSYYSDLDIVVGKPITLKWKTWSGTGIWNGNSVQIKITGNYLIGIEQTYNNKYKMTIVYAGNLSIASGEVTMTYTKAKYGNQYSPHNGIFLMPYVQTEGLLMWSEPEGTIGTSTYKSTLYKITIGTDGTLKATKVET